MSSPLDRLYGRKPDPQEAGAPVPAPATSKEEEAARKELLAEAAEPDFYRAAITRPRPLLGFAVVEKTGTIHGFAYFTLRHPKYQVQAGKEYISFSADGLAVVVEGHGLALVFRALMRHTLYELREFDGKPENDRSVWVDHLQVANPRDMEEAARQLF